MKSLKAIIALAALTTAASMANATETVRTSKGCTITHNDDGTLTIVCPKVGAK